MICRIVILGSVLYTIVNCAHMRAWKYEIISVTGASTDENLLNVSMNIDRLSFDDSAISATFDLKFDADENTTVEMLIFHSVSGRDDDYYETPFKIPKDTTLRTFIEKYYKEITYANLRDCSNFPKFDGEFVAVWPKGTYILRSCKLTGDGLPYFLPSGYYKFCVQVHSQVDMNIVGISKCTPKVI